MTTMGDVVRAAIPSADADLIDFIIMGRTPYPMGRVTAKSLYRAAVRWRRACAKGERLCEFCNRLATPDRWDCEGCREALRKACAS